jgi:hypothetical protein
MFTLSEPSRVALSLSAVVRFHQLFEASSDATLKHNALLAAADMLDRTLPFPDLKAHLSKPGTNQVEQLVAGRERIAAIPPKLWRPARVRPNQFSDIHYRGIRALERVLRLELTDKPALLWGALEPWLRPAWTQYPSLGQECLELKEGLDALLG